MYSSAPVLKVQDKAIGESKKDIWDVGKSIGESGKGILDVGKGIG